MGVGQGGGVLWAGQRGGRGMGQIKLLLKQ